MPYTLLESGNGRTQRVFIEMIGRINGIDIDFTPIDEEAMVIASHDSINGDYSRFIEMFTSCSKPISKEEQINYIETYITSDDLKKQIYDLLK